MPPSAQRAAARVRRFNRFYTRRLGLLDEGHLRSPFSLAEVRVLYEVAYRERATAGAVASALTLDPGYLSRMLRGFRQRGLVAARRAPADGRQRELALTARGRKVFAALDDRATEDVAAMLAGLSAGDRERLLAALETVEALLATPSERHSDRSPAVALRPPRAGDLGWVVERHGELYAEEYGWTTEYEALAAEIVAHFLKHFDPMRERCWIAEYDDAPVGAVMIVKQSKTVAKLRLLHVERTARGRGVGTRLVDECIRFSRAVGYLRITLWTQSTLLAARHIYKAVGFTCVAQAPHHSFGKDLVAETWELSL